VGFSIEIRDVAEQGSSQFKRKGDNPLFPTLPVQREQQIIEVNVPHVNAEGFADSASGIEQEKNEQMKPPLPEALARWLPL
jgi:hypothetical protein